MDSISSDIDSESNRWKFSVLYLGLILIGLVSLFILYQQGILHAIQSWDTPEYSHAYLIPVISAFIIWQKYSEISLTKFEGSWIGTAIVLLGIFCWYLGELSTLFIIIKYAFLLALFGLVLSFSGIKNIHYFSFAVLLLFFTIPLPNFLYNNLSSYLQLISSKLGVEVIRLFGISVFLEGNVIDLGNYKLQVVEACNGLRYLFPLITLGVITAYFYQEKFWKKCVVVISTVPITIFMNSLRIGVIGILVEYWGIEMAEGFLHDFEGWIIFMCCFGILLTEMWLLTRLTSKRKFSDVLSIEVPSKINKTNIQYMTRSIPSQLTASVIMLCSAAVAYSVLPERIEITPDRSSFIQFPYEISSWKSNRKAMEKKFINALKFEDYLLANYSKDNSTLELYIAYYDSQRKGESAHSPRSCLPGAGWRIADRNTVEIPYIDKSGIEHAINVNRMLVQKADEKYLMYYWFKQRHRNLTNEYLVKWFLFWDGMTRNRTDGALIRVMYPLPSNFDVNEGDETIQSFISSTLTSLPAFVPD